MTRLSDRTSADKKPDRPEKAGGEMHDKGEPKARRAVGRHPVTQGRLGTFASFMGYVIRRFAGDRMQQRAAGLTFTSLLAMVPLLTVSFAIFSAFPAFTRLKGEVQAFIFENFVPAVGGTVQQYLEQFTQQTGGLTAIGIIFLIVTAVMLLMTINGTFNDIWRARQTRAVVTRILVFWAVLTLAPLLFGVSLSISSVLFTLAQSTGVESYTGSLTRVAFVLPFILQVFGFAILFLVVPNYPVRRRDALLGGLVASILFESLKKGFGLYVTSFPTYETIYGAMAIIPIFLLWVYLSWIVVLFSAEMTASFQEWRSGSRQLGQQQLTPSARMTAVLSVLYHLLWATQSGRGISDRKFSARTQLGPEALGWATDQLEKSHFISRTDTGAWVLTRDLAGVSLHDLFDSLGLSISRTGASRVADSHWNGRYRELARQLAGSEREIMQITLRELLTPPANAPETAVEDQDQPVQDADWSRKTYIARILTLIGLGSAGSSM